MDTQTPQPVTPPTPTSSVTEPVVAQPKKSKKSFIIAGIVLLVLISFGTSMYLLSQNKSTSAPVAPKKEVVVQQPLTLTLESPTENTVVENSQIAVTGKTLPNTTVVVYSDTADTSVESDAQGNFTGTIDLESGINTLTVTAYSENGDEKSVVMDVVYDPAEGTK